MNYLSQMLKLPVIDSDGEKIGIVNDLGIATGEVFPHVTSLAFQGPGRTPFMISWRKYVDRFDDHGVYLNCTSTDIRFSYLQPQEVLMVRDILNKQIVDTRGLKVVRVNDIKLSITGTNELRLLGAEVGVLGLLRALSPALERLAVRISKAVGKPLEEEIIAWSYMDLLERDTTQLKLSVSHKTLSELHPADVADIIEQLDPRLRTQVFAQLDVATAAEAMAELDDDELMTQMLEGMSDTDASSMLAMMDPDDAADLVEELSYDKAEKLLRLMGVQEEKAIRMLLGYAEDTAGRIMTQEFVALPAVATVADAVEAIGQLDEDFESVYYVYTLDREGAVEGVLSLRRLITASRGTRLKDLAYKDVVYVGPGEDQEDVAEEMTKYNLVAIPVCDDARKILGIITFDDAMEVMSEEHAEDLKIAGMGSSADTAGESVSSFEWFSERQYWVVLWALCSSVIALALEAFGGQGSSFIYPMAAMPVVLTFAGRVIAYVKNFFLEYDDADDEPRPYLAFFLKTFALGLVFALIIALCGQVVSYAAFPDVGGAVERLFERCIGLAAGVVLGEFATSVIYLRVIFWREDHDLDTSGATLSLVGICVAALAYTVGAVAIGLA